MRASAWTRLVLPVLAALLVTLGIGNWGASQSSWWLPLVITACVAAVLIALIHAWVVGPVTANAAGVAFSAEFDPLTNTLNRHGVTIKLMEYMALADRYGNRLSMAIVEIDHLSAMADKYGDRARNQALKTITKVLTETIRMPDRIGRYDADQFLAILPETNMSGACQIAERIRSEVAHTDIEVTDRHEVRLTVSIGVTMFRRGEDVAQLISRAGRVLQQAKALGRNRVLTDLAA